MQDLVIGDAVSLAVETHTCGDKADINNSCCRVVLINENGDCILDTLVKPQTESVTFSKTGLKHQLYMLSKDQAPSVEFVREQVLTLIKGKHLIGYQLPKKMGDFGLLDYLKEGSEEQTPWDKAYDIAKIFNSNPCST
jgi:hypothetical protein